MASTSQNYRKTAIFCLILFISPLLILNTLGFLTPAYQDFSNNNLTILRTSADTDGDGFDDAVESSLGTNPNDTWSYPKPNLVFFGGLEKSGNEINISIINSGIWTAEGVVVIAEIPTIPLTLYNNSDSFFNLAVNEVRSIIIDLSNFDSQLKDSNTHIINIYIDPYNLINETNEIDNIGSNIEITYTKNSSGGMVIDPILIIFMTILSVSSLAIGGGAFVWKKRSGEKPTLKREKKRFGFLERKLEVSPKTEDFDVKKRVIEHKGLTGNKIEPVIKSIEDTSKMTVKKEKDFESEIGIEKVQLSCVVHRGIIVGNVYVCPNCQTIYCHKCAKTIKLKGEKCWSCNNELEIELSTQEKLDLQSNIDFIAQELQESYPGVKEYAHTDKSHVEIPEIKPFGFSFIKPEEYEAINGLSLSLEEKKQFLKEYLTLPKEDRSRLIEEMTMER